MLHRVSTTQPDQPALVFGIPKLVAVRQLEKRARRGLIRHGLIQHPRLRRWPRAGAESGAVQDGALSQWPESALPATKSTTEYQAGSHCGIQSHTMQVEKETSKPSGAQAMTEPGDQRFRSSGVDSAYAWSRLAVALLVSTIGGVGMWSVVVILPVVQSEFGVARADAALPYTMTMIGFGIGGVFMGKLADRFGIVFPVVLGTAMLSLGFALSASSTSILQFGLVQGVLIGFGTSTTFAPLLANTSLWFMKRRGTAVGLIASGNYLAGAVWPPIVQHFVQISGWRATHMGIALFCLATMLPLALLFLRGRPPAEAPDAARAYRGSLPIRSTGLAPGTLQLLLVIAGISCCVAMAMPQVHLVAYCSDLGYGAARGAEMLSLLLACGILSRLVFGWISDHIGGLRTLLLGSFLQAIALVLYLPTNGLVSLYLVSALFGLFQGGIVPSYAIIVREYFSPGEAGARIGTIMLATMFGMAFGGWMSGVIYDTTGSYQVAFIHGILWNLLNISIVGWLLRLAWKRSARATATTPIETSRG
jgi:MFS family permease